MALCGELKQSTTVTISLGPFIDDDDGATEKTLLTIEDTDVYLSKNGAAKAVPHDTNNCTEDANGIYRKQLDDTDTNTLGILTVYVHFTDCLYVRQDYLVLRADIYDSKYGTDYQQVDVIQIGSTTQSATDLKDFADTGYDPTAHKVQGVVLTDTCTTLTGHTVQTGDSYAIVNHADYGNSKLVRSTTPANTLDVSATGEAGLDFDNIKDATGAHTLTNITIPVTTAVTNRVTANTDQIEGVDATNQIRDAVVDDTTRIDASALNTLSSYAPASTIAAATDVSGAHTTTDGLITALNDISAADVNTQVSDVLKVDTISEMAQGKPTATPTFQEALMYLYMMLRNQITITSSNKTFSNDAGTVIWKKALSDDGTTYTEAEGATGP